MTYALRDLVCKTCSGTFKGLPKRQYCSTGCASKRDSTGIHVKHGQSWSAIENAGVRAGEIIAYRAWALGYDGLLHGMFMSDYKWLPGAIEHAPKVHPTWGEGLHAFKTLNEAKQQYSCYSLTDLGVVFGEVALWGEVIEHETGYRAEYASIRKIIALWSGLSHRSWSFKFWKPQPLRQLRRAYSIPLDDKGTAA